MSHSKVYLVGAGPGDPHLITVKGLNLVKQADCIIYDGLANPLLLGHARPDAELISVSKRSGAHSMKQPQINALIIEKALQHKIIVRLKGGDPCLFGRAAEEVNACIEARVDFEIVPGITAGIAAPEYAGMFITNREYSSAVCFITGRQAEGKDPDLNWQWLAGFDGSLVFYMGMERIEEIAQKLVDNGKPAQTPAAVIHRATLPQQRVVFSNLAEIAHKCAQEKIEAPSIIIIGTAAEGFAQANWFMKNPLFGKRVLITRDADGNRIFAEKLACCGAEPVIFDSIEIVDNTKSELAAGVLANIGQFDWIVFTSSNGVQYTFDRLLKNGFDARAFAAAKIACIGLPTAQKLAEYGLKADFVPQSFTSEQMSSEMTAVFDLRDKRIALLRSKIAPKDIVRVLTDAGAQVTDAPIYDVTAKAQSSEVIGSINQQLEHGQIDYVIFTSASTACAFINSMPQGLIAGSKAKIVSIGPAATKKLVSMGFAPDLEAKVHTVDGIIDLLKEQS